jgi:hypothetical protein
LRKEFPVLAILVISTFSLLGVFNYLYIVVPDNEVMWKGVYPAGRSSYLQYAAITSDSGFLFSTHTWGSTWLESTWLQKLDANGSIQWSKTYPNSNISIICFISQSADGGYVLAGSAFDSPTSSRYFMAKVDGSGNLEWNRTCGDGIAMWVHQSVDGGYVSVGSDLNNSILAVKTQSNGTVQWSRAHLISGVTFSFGEIFASASDGGCLVMKDILTTINETYRNGAWIAKMDGEGNQLWNRTVYQTLPWTLYMVSAKETPDGGCILLGASTLPGRGAKAWLYKLDSNFSTEWRIPFSDASYSTPYEVIRTSDGGYVAAVGAQWVPRDRRLWLWKVDENGTTQWRKPLDADYYAGFLYQTPSGTYILGGDVLDQNHNWFVSIVKVSGSPPYYPPEVVPLIYQAFDTLLVLSIVGTVVVAVMTVRRKQRASVPSSTGG